MTYPNPASIMLSEAFYTYTDPTPVKHPNFIQLNTALAQDLGFTGDTSELLSLFSGNTIPKRYAPVAMVYAGHQFGYFTPQLGDGRAILLGAFPNQKGKLFDVQLKGAGRTPFSRQGDGRSALGPVIREYIVSEAMHALGIPTTRALAAVTTGEQVYRETALPGAIFTRVASSHIRVGTFEYFASQGNLEAVQELANYAISRHYSSVASAKNKYLSLLQSVIEAQAKLVAQWMSVGFIHGVMNTDNTSISGETIDYGPCAFMDYFEPQMVISSIDQGGRYAYSNQPSIMKWNMACFAQTLLPLFHDNEDKALELAQEAIDSFDALFHRFWLAKMASKLGIASPTPKDEDLIRRFLALLAQDQLDFTVSFRALLEDSPPFDPQWVADWQQRSPDKDLITRTNPAVIPRNHHIEKALVLATTKNDFSLMDTLLQALKKPFERSSSLEFLTAPPTPEERITATFCGT